MKNVVAVVVAHSEKESNFWQKGGGKKHDNEKG